MRARLIIVLCMCIFTPAALGQSNRARVSILCIPELTADDIRRPELQSLRTIVPESAVGWMNARMARIPGVEDRKRSGSENEASGYLTLGAGSRAYAPESSGVDAARLTSLNSKLDHDVKVGALGDLLHAAGLRIFLTGNDDTDVPGRAAALLITDGEGKVDSPASFAGATIHDETAPYGIRSLGPLAVARILSEADVQVFGDLARAKKYANLCLPAVAEKHKTEALRRLDGVITAWWNIDAFPRTLRIILAPCASFNSPSLDRLAPLLMSGEGITPGLLISCSTRTPGLVANTDFLPTIASWLNLKPPSGIVGRTIYSTVGSKDVDVWASIRDDWLANGRRQAVFGGLPTIQFAILLISTGCWIYRTRLRTAISVTGLALAAAILAIPLSLFALPLFGAPSLIGDGVVLTTLLALAVFVAQRAQGRAAAIIRVVTGFTMLLVVVDLASGARLLRMAPMSYSVMEGARYYGIGNEYVGALLGCIMALAMHSPALVARWKISVAALLVLGVLIGHPTLGANIGGMAGVVAAAIGFGLTCWRGRPRIIDAVACIFVAGLMLAGILLLDAARSGDAQSHFARAFQSNSGLMSIAARKLALNLFLLFHSPWALGLFGSIIAFGAFWKSASPEVRDQLWTTRETQAAFYGTAFGASALFLFNDSGVVAASECLMVAWAGGFFYLHALAGQRLPRAKLDKGPGRRHTVRNRR